LQLVEISRRLIGHSILCVLQSQPLLLQSLSEGRYSFFVFGRLRAQQERSKKQGFNL